MSFEKWLNYLMSAEKTSFISGSLRKVHYKFPDGKEMAEEYSMDNGIVVRRAWKQAKTLMGEQKWEIELGDDPKLLLPSGAFGTLNNPAYNDSFMIRESNTEPILSTRVTKKNIEWRIRNLPYPIETYDVKADPKKPAIIVRTLNKKYYKVIQVPELERCNLLPDQRNITVHHHHNTLIITYQKPLKLIEMDVQVLLMLKDVQTRGDVDEMIKSLFVK